MDSEEVMKKVQEGIRKQFKNSDVTVSWYSKQTLVLTANGNTMFTVVVRELPNND